MNLTYDSQMFRETFEGVTWLNGFMRNVRRFSDKPAAIDPQSGRTWGYKSLMPTKRICKRYEKDGVKKNDIVFMQLYNSPFLFSYIAPQTRCNLKSANFNLSEAKPQKLWDTTSLLFMFMMQTLCKQPYRLLKSESISQ